MTDEPTEGAPEPLGATPDATGVNFAVYSANATAIEVCLFDATGEHDVGRFLLPGRTGAVWHGHIAGIGAGTRYGLRAHGPYAPAEGHRFAPGKLLLDPYAAAIDRPFRPHRSLFDDDDDDADSAAAMPKAIVLPPAPIGPPPAPLVPWDRTVIYEAHVRGFTRHHPDIPEALRGTFAALVDPAVIAHLRRLGVTTLEIMPAMAWVDERHLMQLGLGNYWGYNPIAWMAPDPRLAPGGWDEVRGAVAALAEAGIETVLDVVLNHSGEGDAVGPTLSLRGLDNATYYRLAADRAHYIDDAGCGNILALDRPPVVRLAMDALRTWVRRAGLHGFRFDLATTLGRTDRGFEAAAPLLSAIAQDPELRGLKLIAEPWDIGPGGYQVGAFPAAWGEWNDRFRDSVRRFWRGDDGMRGELATRIAGSADLFAAKRHASRSVNFVVAHDGFTLADLVSYAGKHNEANGEGNRDGTDANHSWNHGVEGPSADARTQEARRRDQRALLATLLLARGTPMLAMGAEFGHSQQGNNNAYAQDGSLSWLDWTRADTSLTEFTAQVIALRAAHPALRADAFLTGTANDAGMLPDVAWRAPDGHAMRDADWADTRGETLVVVLTTPDDRVTLVLHRGWGSVAVTLPDPREGFGWHLAADSTGEAAAPDGLRLACPHRAVLAMCEVAAPGRRAGRGDPALLERLAEAAGIAPHWHEIDGTRHDVSDDTKRALLAAMCLPAGSSGELRDSLHRFAETHQRRPLPHALVGREGEALSVPLVIEGATDRRRREFVLEGEAGERETVTVEPAAGYEHDLVCADARRAQVWQVKLPPLPVGRWRLAADDRPEIGCSLTVAPQACHLPPSLASGGRRFGLAAHLYSLRRAGDQGIGDFTTLAQFGRAAAGAGAAVVGLNPLHALFPQDRERASPYHPSDRRFLDAIYIDVAAGGGALDSAEARAVLAARAAEIAELSAQPLVDYPRVWAAKLAVLDAAFAAFVRGGGAEDDMDAFLTHGGERLTRFATFQAIAERFPGSDWQHWPEGLRDPHHADVADFARAHAARVRFHLWLQWLADRQFAGAASASGLEIGLYRDLAVGTAPDGAEAWAGAEELAMGVSIGAPPDPFSAAGQIWHLPPPDPWRIREGGYRTLAGLFAANMRHAGALRIDHAMGLERLFWIPAGGSGADGAYVGYPRADLIGELALESQRARCLVVGEDLGTVPDGFREALAAADIFSYRVLWFEREGAGFLPADRYPAHAVACVSTHDLPTLAGWRKGTDIAERAALGLLPGNDTAAAWAERAAEMTALTKAVGGAPDAPAVHRFLASTPSALVLAQADDLAGETMALNLPGTDRERPNWRRKLLPAVDELLRSASSRAIVHTLRPNRIA
jgi:glycogen debranching enzyme GlgX/4-alpha-glucanotransferase